HLNILVFAYVFPPDAGSGTYRTLYFTNHWARLGDAVTIVTVQERCFLPNALVDRALCHEVHPAIRIERAGAKRPLQALLKLRRICSWNAASHDAPASRGERSGDRSSGPGRSVLRAIKDTITDLLACPDEHVGWIPEAVRRGYRTSRNRPID